MSTVGDGRLPAACWPCGVWHRLRAWHCQACCLGAGEPWLPASPVLAMQCPVQPSCDVGSSLLPGCGAMRLAASYMLAVQGVAC